MCLPAGLEGDQFGKMRATDKEERDELSRRVAKIIIGFTDIVMTPVYTQGDESS